MTISIIKRSTKFFKEKDGVIKEPETKEKVLSEFRTDNRNSTAILQLFANPGAEDMVVNKDGDIEIEKYMFDETFSGDEFIIIKFAK